jgi:hypothetical protein
MQGIVSPVIKISHSHELSKIFASFSISHALRDPYCQLEVFEFNSTRAVGFTPPVTPPHATLKGLFDGH